MRIKKQLTYIFFKLYIISYLAVVIVAFFINSYLLSLLGCVAMYYIAYYSFIHSIRYKTDTEIKSMVANEGHYRPVNILPIMLLDIFFLVLGFIQNIDIVYFGDFNNLLLAIVISIYLLYDNEKNRKTALKLEQDKQELINKYGKDEFDRITKDCDKVVKELEEKLNEIDKKGRG